MSDAITALQDIVILAAKRGDIHFTLDAEESEKLRGLLEEIVEVAGDSLEDHIKAVRPRVRKARVYKTIVEEVAALVDDNDISAPEANYYTIELIGELLNRYNIEVTV
jgi:hypothetical protein